jgi:DtxR family Mn-dependent transcriptional regulator
MYSIMTLNLEDYLLVIWEHTETFGRISESDISKRLKISAPTVTEYVSKIEQMGLIDKKPREVMLTQAGRKLAIPTVRAHRIAEVFAHRFLEVPWEDVHKAVMDLEHLFSGAYGDNLFRNLGSPESCPHGNPISVVQPGNSESVSLLPPGNYELQRIVFEEYDLLLRLADASMFPGSRVKLAKDGESVLESENASVKLSDRESLMIHLRKPKV